MTAGEYKFFKAYNNDWVERTVLSEAGKSIGFDSNLDPIMISNPYINSPASTITNQQITNWDTAYSWGNSGSLNYIWNQDTVDQSASLRITGNGTFGGKVLIGNNSGSPAAVDLHVVGSSIVTGTSYFSTDYLTYIKSQNSNLLFGTSGLTQATLGFDGKFKLEILTASKLVFTDSAKNLTTTGIGTSSQFLKGDGSLDSNIYVSTSNNKTAYDYNIIGSRDGVNTTFTLPENFIVNSTKVYLNGLRLTLGASYDYVESGTTQIIFNYPIRNTDLIAVDYIKL